jgi:Flp pilus assembly protein TadD
VLELEPRHFGALSGLGLIFRALDDDARAMAAYRQALEIDPFLTDVREALEAIEAETAGSSL